MSTFRSYLTAIICTIAMAGVASAQTPAAAQKAAPAASSEKAAVLNLNTATASELEHLPGIGPKVAARIVEYRTKKGPFRKTEDIMQTAR